MDASIGKVFLYEKQANSIPLFGNHQWNLVPQIWQQCVRVVETNQDEEEYKSKEDD